MSLLERFRESQTQTGLTTDEVLQIIGGRGGARRRWIIEHLADRDGSATKRELSELLSFVESDCDHPDEVHGSERRAAYVALHQAYLPELDEEGVIEYERSEVRPTDRCRRLARIVAEVRRMNGGGADA